MKKLLSIIIFVIYFSCSKADSVQEVNDPESFELISPSNGETCLDGIDQNDLQASVFFSWRSSANAKSYALEIENLSSGEKINVNSSSTSLNQNLNKAKPYSWIVTAIGEPGSLSAKSPKWSFYLSGEDQISYGPFPPELTSPRPSSTITPNPDGQVTLTWVGSDQDENISGYEVYLDTQDASTLIRKVDGQTTSVLVDVVSENTYYWKILATDENDFKSSSGVYAFIVN